MREPFTYSKIHNHVVTTLLKKTVVRNIDKNCVVKKGHALIYHKTDSLTPGYLDEYVHTNNWEIVKAVEILNTLGFWVDVIDRNISDDFTPEDKYDLFIGIGADSSGRHYAKYAQHLTKAIKIFYATSANPEIRNANIQKRHQYFQKRHNKTLPLRRLTQEVNMAESMAVTDHIFCVGNKTTIAGYQQYHKPIHRIFLSTSPQLRFDNQALYRKDPRHFLFFAGSGNILKGLDIAIEAFKDLTQLNLHICTSLEPEMKEMYTKELTQKPNIRSWGFVKVGSKTFRELTAQCAFTILPSSTEGTATSITTCMRRGLIPVVTPQTGIDTTGFGFLIDDINPQKVRDLIETISHLPPPDLQRRILTSYLQSFQYTQSAYEKSLIQALWKVLDKKYTPHQRLKAMIK